MTGINNEAGKPTHEHILELHRAHLEAERLRRELLHSDSPATTAGTIKSNSG